MFTSNSLSWRALPWLNVTLDIFHSGSRNESVLLKGYLFFEQARAASHSDQAINQSDGHI